MKKPVEMQINSFRKNLFNLKKYRVSGIVIDYRDWYCARGVCAALRIDDVSNALGRLRKDDLLSASLDFDGGEYTYEKIYVSEEGITQLALQGTTPEAIAFQKAVALRISNGLEECEDFCKPLYDLAPLSPFY